VVIATKFGFDLSPDFDPRSIDRALSATRAADGN
jgi:hypothetical protein